MALSLVADDVQPFPPNTSTTLEELTSGIRFYLREMGQNIIEIGNRLIMAKGLMRHGEWMRWLESSFPFTYRSARNFINVAKRFGKSEIDFTFGSTQMIQMLSLPEGEEKKFLEEQATEGHIVAEMSVKTLRVEIQKYKAKLSSVNGGIESGSDNSTSTSLAEFPLKVEEESKNESSTSQNSLEQLFGMMNALPTGDNLKSLVAQSASEDIQALKEQLKKLSAIYGDIQAYLTEWESGKDRSVEEKAVETDVKASGVEEPVARTAVDEKGGDNENSLESRIEKICDKKEIEETDRHAILSALYQIALNDDENFTRTEYIHSMIADIGFEVVHKVPTKDLYHVLYFTALKFHIST